MNNYVRKNNVIILLILLLCLIFIASCSKNEAKHSGQEGKENNRSNKNQSYDESLPRLYNLGIDVTKDVVITNVALADYKAGHKGFYFFGDTLPGNRINPNFEFASVRKDTKIKSPINGIIAFIQKQSESNDYEVYLQEKENSAWVISLDHIVNLNVKKGDKIKSGKFIGNPAMENNGLYRFEIQITKSQGDGQSHCPVDLLDKPNKKANEQALDSMMRAWNNLFGSQIYDIATQNPIGCKKTSLTNEEVGNH